MSDLLNIFVGARLITITRGGTLFRREDPVTSMFLVRSGAIALERSMSDGTSLTLHTVTAGNVLAEASLFAEAYHCDAVAKTDSQIAAIPHATFREALQKTPKAALSLLEVCAKELQSQRARIEILRLRRVSDRLDAWLNLYGNPAKGQWVSVADAINVSQPALYRELAKRRG